MWIVRLALRRPYTFVVAALLILILGPIVIYRTPTDVFPTINIPVVSIVWNYSGLAPQDISDRIVALTERTRRRLKKIPPQDISDLKRWYADIGAKVRKGQLLADIETPEVDQQLLQARASFDQSVANYRQIVLTSFREVEDNLAALRILQSEALRQQEAVTASDRSLNLSLNRYRGGVTTYLEVTTAQGIALANQRTAVQILARRMNSSVLLIQALGGGWDAKTLPSDSSSTSSRVKGQ